MKNKIWIVVYEVLDDGGEADWCFHVAEDMDHEEAVRIAVKDYKKNHDWDDNEPDPAVADTFGRIWFDSVRAPKPYEIIIREISNG